jgi:hypothetical protein
MQWQDIAMCLAFDDWLRYQMYVSPKCLGRDTRELTWLMIRYFSEAAACGES